MYQTTAQAIECEAAEHIRECNRTLKAPANYETLVAGDVVEFDGMTKTVEREGVERFSIVVYFTDGTQVDKIDFFERGGRRVNRRNGNLAGLFLSE